MDNNKEKALLAAKGFASFCDQFETSNSIYKRVLLEIFFEELMSGTSIYLSSQAGQEGNQDISDIEQSQQMQPGTSSQPPDIKSTAEDAI